jgi:hypothetical protein
VQPAPEPPAVPEVQVPLPVPPEAQEPVPGLVEAPPQAPAGLDLERLEQRLRGSRSLGVFTKLALKNDIDDLVEDAGAFHRKGSGQLSALRERFDLLVMKVMSLLQDDEPELADEIARSREGLWQLLADPAEYAKLSS